jgi:hypothetical protein
VIKPPFPVRLFSAKVILFMVVIVVASALYLLAPLFSRLWSEKSEETKLPAAIKAGAPATQAAPARVKIGTGAELAIDQSPKNSSAYSNGGFTTYKPGIPRSVRVTATPEGQYLLYIDKPNWWLYAQSKEEAEWLDQQGFPTPGEEQVLQAASDNELKTLASNGDLNAQAHLAVRAAKEALLKGSAEEIQHAKIALETASLQGGPYAAIMIVKGFGEMLGELRGAVPAEMPERQRKAIRDYDEIQQQASVIGSAMGDQSIPLLKRQMAAQFLERQKLIPNAKAIDAPGEWIASASVRRQQLGYPPLIIVPRPGMSHYEGKVFERY